MSRYKIVFFYLLIVTLLISLISMICCIKVARDIAEMKTMSKDILQMEVHEAIAGAQTTDLSQENNNRKEIIEEYIKMPEIEDQGAGIAELEEEITEPVRVAKASLGTMTITHYCPCEKCCPGYGNGITASGATCTEGTTIACDFLPFGTQVEIDGHIYTVQDRIGSGSKNHIDIFVSDHQRALDLGRKKVEVFEVM